MSTTIAELMAYSNTCQSNRQANVCALLISYSRHPDADLTNALNNTGISLSQFLVTLQQVDQEACDDSTFIDFFVTKAIGLGSYPTGIDLLRELTTLENHPVIDALVYAGMDLKQFQHNLAPRYLISQFYQPQQQHHTVGEQSREQVNTLFGKPYLQSLHDVVLFNPDNQQTTREVLRPLLLKAKDKLNDSGIQLHTDDTALIDFLSQNIAAHKLAQPADYIIKALLLPLAKAVNHAGQGTPLQLVLDQDFYSRGIVKDHPAITHNT